MLPNINLTPEQAKFATLASDLNLDHLFDFEIRTFKSEAVTSYFKTASSGESILLKFLLGVWFNENNFSFNLIEAAQVLDEKSRLTISNWLADPFFP